MDPEVKKDIEVLEIMIHAVKENDGVSGIESAMNQMIDGNFPNSPYTEHDDINDLICLLLDPWIKASGEVVEEDGSQAVFNESELPQPESEAWRKKFLADLQKLKALIQLSHRH